MKCPKCKSEYQSGALECPKCGLIFKKYEQYRKQQILKKMMKCPACDKMISKNAEACPSCGEPINIKREPPHQPNPSQAKPAALLPPGKTVNCNKCTFTYDKELTKCPECGATNTKKGHIAGAPKGFWVFIGIIVAIFLFSTISNFISPPPPKETKKEIIKPPPKPKTAKELRKEKILEHFSAWDGSHRGLARYIKDNMNDPSSFDHVETLYGDKGDHLIVVTKFRGKNAFGGVVLQSIKAKVDLNGNVLQIIK